LANLDNRPIIHNPERVRYTKADMYWMALGELGSYIASAVLAIIAYSKASDHLPSWRFFAAFVVFIISSKILHWFVHLGYRPDVDA
jgi:hypothetical protein